ncbi:MAG: transcriptional regulator NrdR [Eubacteriales bacterium]|nr:transcriptional regulator NrdR [Eubacteriales bacterium]MDY3332781.1 transcriptional regulator NrdR [Gallibacter sp.]
MKCSVCGDRNTKVIDSRPIDEDRAVRRRRVCEQCGHRFTTYEKQEEVVLMVIKKDGSREAFDRNKVLNGIIKACEKRKVERSKMDAIVDNIERGLANTMTKEIESTFIGELIMEALKEIDEVAYVRFASVYRQFTDVETFISEINKLLEK